MALLELRHVSKDWEVGPGTTTTILKDVSLKVEEGDFVALLGPSGSGKSTLLRIIAGLIPPTEGQVLYHGRPVDGVAPGVAMIFQNFALFPWLTVLENVELGLERTDIPPAEKRKRALQVIDMVGLDGFETAFPKELSGGMRQRVGFGRALVAEPDVLLMDEPFSALDVLTAENLRRDLLELWLEKKIRTKAIVLVTHSIEEAVYLASRAVVLSRDPAQVVTDIRITLPHWRDKQSPTFLSLVDQLYAIITRRTPVAEAVPAAAKSMTRVPEVRSGALTGLLELLDDLESRTDLYKLADNLMLDVEDFLPIVEGAELLGLVKVEHGDIELTDVGRRFADASVLERKEIFRDLVLKKVPTMEKMLWVLQSKRNKQIAREFFLQIFERRFSPEEAAKQLDILIDWGRYAELFGYDEQGGRLYLEGEEDAP
ncbi:ABC transporter ATP-binding protein [Kyrpidia tusciae]|uniref:ABC transporter related protein n=1 Tax=Kyrpidia tusciae (strain DSM 2912 / NBRC 15312 / T2) TaxID=562970 RepID=D5WQC8_KYRT2|nr:nitrate/sulfonate/bicarbonate ABC transporter ATP-binding protein [Kyrpidia tusciae]ADG06537.1 ABC transporter related protein [Kyrpidia tusciae DSM 2912]MBE3551336.1 nitrate/sulfonate/bicarbonate ABC transporter ATP-binding protein [Kyrpidia tusciae]